MRICLFVLSLLLVGELALASGSEDFPGVVRIRIERGPEIVADAFFDGESSVTSSITNLVNHELSYFSYASPIDSQKTTYFFYAKLLTLEFTCAVLINDREVARNTSVVKIEAEPGQVYVAKPAFLENRSSCETNVVPQHRPN